MLTGNHKKDGLSVVSTYRGDASRRKGEQSEIINVTVPICAQVRYTKCSKKALFPFPYHPGSALRRLNKNQALYSPLWSIPHPARNLLTLLGERVTALGQSFNVQTKKT